MATALTGSKCSHRPKQRDNTIVLGEIGKELTFFCAMTFIFVRDLAQSSVSRLLLIDEHV